MAESVAKITALELNGVNVEDFITVQPTEVLHAIQVPLMNKTNHSSITSRYGLSITFVVPSNGYATDIILKNGTITLQYDNGARFTYGGCYALTETPGSIETDATTALTNVIAYGAESFNKE